MEHRWEYLRVTVVSSRFEEEMARYGSDGWELLSCPLVERDRCLPVDYYLCVFKRPKGGA